MRSFGSRSSGPRVGMRGAASSHAWRVCAAGLALLAGSAAALASDGVIRTTSLSHNPDHDYRPLVPLAGDAFTVRFQALRGDLTAARVLRAENGVTTPYEATRLESRGSYDIWQASLPAATATSLSYVIEAQDGAARAYLGANGTVTTTTPPAGYVMNFQTLSHAPLGATPTSRGTVFRVWAPGASTAEVRGSFNSFGANPATRVVMTKGTDGVFTAHVPAASNGQTYKYYFNNNLWKYDARARGVLPNDSYNGRIFDPVLYTWQVNDFTPAPRDQWVVYQLHVHTFAGRNDPRGSFTRYSTYSDVALRADHLAELGVNVVYLNPVNEWPGEMSGGYNPMTFWAFESVQGNYNTFKSMVDALHARGIAVILDVVWNHVDGGTIELRQYDGTNIYFDAVPPETGVGPQLDFDRPEVRDYFLDSAEMLLGECRIDGFRMDAVFLMTNGAITPQANSGRLLLQQFNNLIDRRYTDAFTIAENYDNSSFDVNPTSQGGLGFDAQYHFILREALEQAVEGAMHGGADVGRVANALGGSGTQSTGTRAFNYFELHDEAWPLNGRERTPRDIDPTAPSDTPEARGLSLVGNALVLLARGIPAILMGTEWLEDDGWEFNKIDWDHKDRYPGVFRFYQDLIALRKSKPALFANAALRLIQTNDGADVIIFERTGADGRSYLAAANFGAVNFTSYLVGAPRPGTWGVIVNSDADRYGGADRGTPMGPAGNLTTLPQPRDGQAQSLDIALPPRSILLLQHNPEHIVACPSDFNGDGQPGDIFDLFDFLAALSTGADFNQDTVGGDIFDLFDFLGVLDAGCP